MISLEQIKDLQQRVETLGRCIDVEGKRADVAARQERTLAADFWDDPKEAEKFLKELSGVKFWVTGYDKIASGVEDLNVLLEFEDEEIDQAYAAVIEELEALELRNMLGEEGDNLGAVLTINSGAGGTEANDWSAMLMRMYVRWAERNGYKVTITDELEGEDAGIKSVTMQVEATMLSVISRQRAECIVLCVFLLSMLRESVRRHSLLSSCILWSMIRSRSKSMPETLSGTHIVRAEPADRM